MLRKEYAENPFQKEEYGRLFSFSYLVKMLSPVSVILSSAFSFTIFESPKENFLGLFLILTHRYFDCTLFVFYVEPFLFLVCSDCSIFQFCS